jgi:hypothetical protein
VKEHASAFALFVKEKERIERNNKEINSFFDMF